MPSHVMPPLFLICSMDTTAVLTGTAKPTPWLALVPELVAIWSLMPMTAPCASISGPPELPGLMAASV